jgi:hypothetical protein
MDDLQRLVAIESIKNTKARYWYAVDKKDWPMLGMTFCEDASFDIRGERDLKPGESYDRLVPYAEALAAGDDLVKKGRDNIIAFISDVMQTWISVHQGWGFIIDFVDDTHAKVIIPQIDDIDDGQHRMVGRGHYYETFRKDPDGVWRIEEFVLSRTRMDGEHPMDAENPSGKH